MDHTSTAGVNGAPAGPPGSCTKISGALNTGIPYDNKIHVWVIKVKYGATVASSNFTISVDGNEIRSVNGIRVRMNLVKLFRNRNNDSKFNASFFEFFTYDSLISDQEIQSLSYWLVCKWGVQI